MYNSSSTSSSEIETSSLLLSFSAFTVANHINASYKQKTKYLSHRNSDNYVFEDDGRGGEVRDGQLRCDFRLMSLFD